MNISAENLQRRHRNKNRNVNFENATFRSHELHVPSLLFQDDIKFGAGGYLNESGHFVPNPPQPVRTLNARNYSKFNAGSIRPPRHPFRLSEQNMFSASGDNEQSISPNCIASCSSFQESAGYQEKIGRRTDSPNSFSSPSQNQPRHANSFQQRTPSKQSTKQSYRGKYSYYSNRCGGTRHIKSKSTSDTPTVTPNIIVANQKATNLSTARNITEQPDPRILCPNIPLYGHCSYDSECQFSHDIHQTQNCSSLFRNAEFFTQTTPPSSLSSNRFHASGTLSVLSSNAYSCRPVYVSLTESESASNPVDNRPNSGFHGYNQRGFDSFEKHNVRHFQSYSGDNALNKTYERQNQNSSNIEDRKSKDGYNISEVRNNENQLAPFPKHITAPYLQPCIPIAYTCPHVSSNLYKGITPSSTLLGPRYYSTAYGTSAANSAIAPEQSISAQSTVSSTPIDLSDSQLIGNGTDICVTQQNDNEHFSVKELTSRFDAGPISKIFGSNAISVTDDVASQSSHAFENSVISPVPSIVYDPFTLANIGTICNYDNIFHAHCRPPFSPSSSFHCSTPTTPVSTSFVASASSIQPSIILSPSLSTDFSSAPLYILSESIAFSTVASADFSDSCSASSSSVAPLASSSISSFALSSESVAFLSTAVTSSSALFGALPVEVDSSSVSLAFVSESVASLSASIVSSSLPTTPLPFVASSLDSSNALALPAGFAPFFALPTAPAVFLSAPMSSISLTTSAFAPCGSVATQASSGTSASADNLSVPFMPCSFSTSSFMASFITAAPFMPYSVKTTSFMPSSVTSASFVSSRTSSSFVPPASRVSASFSPSFATSVSFVPSAAIPSTTSFVFSTASSFIPCATASPGVSFAASSTASLISPAFTSSASFIPFTPSPAFLAPLPLPSAFLPASSLSFIPASAPSPPFSYFNNLESSATTYDTLAFSTPIFNSYSLLDAPFPASSSNFDADKSEESADRHYNHPSLINYENFFSSVISLCSLSNAGSTRFAADIQRPTICNSGGIANKSSSALASANSLVPVHNNPLSNFLNTFSAVQNDPIASRNLVNDLASNTSQSLLGISGAAYLPLSSIYNENGAYESDYYQSSVATSLQLYDNSPNISTIHSNPESPILNMYRLSFTEQNLGAANLPVTTCEELSNNTALFLSFTQNNEGDAYPSRLTSDTSYNKHSSNNKGDAGSAAVSVVKMQNQLNLRNNAQKNISFSSRVTPSISDTYNFVRPSSSATSHNNPPGSVYPFCYYKDINAIPHTNFRNNSRNLNGNTSASNPPPPAPPPPPPGRYYTGNQYHTIGFSESGQVDVSAQQISRQIPTIIEVKLGSLSNNMYSHFSSNKTLTTQSLNRS